MGRIMIDLDVVTNALWKGSNKATALRFLKEIKEKEVEVFTPYSLLQRVLAWKHRKLTAKIFNFYSVYSDRILSLEKIGVKKEDAVLVLIASAFELEIKTFNKKHLYNKYQAINEILKKFGLKEVEINVPS